MKGVFDARKSLRVLAEEWTGCTDCSLGTTRELRGGHQVFGAGTDKRGILFLGSEPDMAGERESRAVGGKGGMLLARLLDHFRVKNFFVTNLVACLSCTPMLDEQGNQMFSKGYRGQLPAPRYKEQHALRPQIVACANRVFEEIYIIDPLIIVTMGQLAAATLRGSSFNLVRERGTAETISIPGAGHTAVLSPKRKEWLRKVHGQMVSPTERSSVRYTMIPTLHPSDVRDSLNDNHNGNPFELFTRDVRIAKKLYDTYNEELYGHVPDDYMKSLEHTPYDIAEEFNREDEAERNGDE